MKMRLAFGIVLLASLLRPAAASTPPPPPVHYPQIVRLSTIEGDVRVSRGGQQGQAKNVDWEKAATGLPLASGFSLATGNGRAEIELEDASTFYLAENSVVVFNDLETVGEVPRTEVALVTGTVSLHVRPSVAGEQFVLRTPTDTLQVLYPNRSDLRVTGYIDATAITPTGASRVDTGSGVRMIHSGQTAYFHSGRRLSADARPPEASFADWDAWVNTRYAARSNAIAAMEKQTGLQAPVPGLDQLQGQGKFEDCGKYGPCWEPPATVRYGDVPAAAPTLTRTAASVPGSAVALQGESAPPTMQPVASAKRPFVSGDTGDMVDLDPFFPCDPYRFYFRSDYLYGAAGYLSEPMDGDGLWMSAYPWNWAVCHTGGWIYRQNRYLWVPGRKRHHRAPVRWIKDGRKTAYVPLHPRDEKGKAPLNARHGLFMTGKNGPTWQRVNLKPGSELKILNTPPREFRKGPEIRLARADSPHMEARTLNPVTGPGGIRTAMPIVFDHKSQSFMTSHEVREGNNVRTVTEPMGSYLARSGVGGFGGPSAFRGASGVAGGGRVAAVGGGNAGSFRGGGVFTGAGAAGESRGGGSFNSAGASGGFHGGGGFSGGGGGGFSGGGSHTGAGGGGGASGGGGGHH